MNRDCIVVAASVFFLSASSASVSHAAVSLSLVPQAPGPYLPGQSLDVDVFLLNEGEGRMDMRLLQMDFALTDPAIDVHSVEFDFSSIINNYGYGDFNSGTVHNRTFIAIPEPWIPTLSYTDGPNHLSVVRLSLPDEPRDYVLDLLNPLAPDNNTGALFQWDWAPTQSAWSGDGTLTGGRMTLAVIPEPATLLLLVVGAAFGCRREIGGRTCAIERR